MRLGVAKRIVIVESKSVSEFDRQYKDQRVRLKDQKSGLKDQKSGLKDRKSWLKVDLYQKWRWKWPNRPIFDINWY